MSTIPGLRQLEDLFRHCHSGPNVLLYDPMCDLTFIYGERFTPLVSYLRSELAYTSLPVETTALVIHERQHYLDLRHTAYGLREMELFDGIVKGLADSVGRHFTSTESSAGSALSSPGLGLLYESHLNTSAIQTFGRDIDPMIFVGLRGEVGVDFRMEGIPRFDAIRLAFSDPHDGAIVARVSVAEKSVVELSALGAEYLWRWSVEASAATSNDQRGAVFGRLEEDLFLLVHDFDKPDYLAAFHAAHLVLQQARSDQSGNFSLLRSLFLSSLVARIAIHVVGTSSARHMIWDKKLTAVFGGEDAVGHLSTNLCTVFYNLLEGARSITITPNLVPHEWMLALIRTVGLGSPHEILLNGAAELNEMQQELRVLGEAVETHQSRRITAGLSFLSQVAATVDTATEPELLMFFDALHPVEWVVPLTNLGEPILIHGGNADHEDADARVERGLAVWAARVMMRRLSVEVGKQFGD